MVRIASAGNTEVPCYLALKELGFEVTVQRVGGREVWIAAEQDVRIMAEEGPCMLLGLAKLIELRGEDWKAADEDIDHFIAQFYPPEKQSASE
ncbi:MAG: hypothetical protein ACJ74W_20270 [Pyrinomonadaceae bacterium]